MIRKNLDVLLVGGGGRENALARALARSPRTRKLAAAPGNPGIAEICTCHAVAAHDVAGLTRLASGLGTDLVVAGPEQPLVDGLTDSLNAHGIPVAGPTRAASRLEGSKVFAKRTMTRLGIPQAEPYEVFDDFAAAERHLKRCEVPVVVKADGLAAGKGVVVASARGEAIAAAREMLVDGRFGDAGRRIVVEPCLEGEEVSLLFFCDGRHAVPLVSARDYKRIGDGDQGPNTGGMGAHSPGSVDDALVETVRDTVVAPLLAGMAAERAFYKGVLYCGLMLTAEGPRVLEFNCRFGDPEAQVILPRLRSCLTTLLELSALDSLAGVELDWDPRAALCVVLASAGYPTSPRSGDRIEGLDELELGGDLFVDHAGTRTEDGELFTAGGRVLSVGALGADVAAARKKAYAAASRIHFDGCQMRSDIGAAVAQLEEVAR